MGEVQPFPTIVTQRRIVKNQQPYDSPTPYRIAIIGEAPGEDEENHGIPFVGRSGQHLDRELRGVGIDRNRCFVGNICQVRPPGNNIGLFLWDGPEITDGLNALKEDLLLFNPNVCLLLGGTPLRAARGSTSDKITSWRGSLFRSNVLDSPFFDRKCLPSLHPTYILREFEGNPLFRFDLSRARSEGESPILLLPERELITNYDAATLCHIMDQWPTGQRCSLDIEGGLSGKYKGWPCVSICARPTKSITIAWGRLQLDDHVRVLMSFARLMYREDVPKVLQNQLSDNFKLSYGYGIPIRNVTEDVMIKGWAIYAELPRSLSVQASIWTREPHWKDNSMYSGSGEGLFRGCALDSAVTLEICNAQDAYYIADEPGFPAILKRRSQEHYRKMIEIQNPFLYMQLRGIAYNQEAVNEHLIKTKAELLPVATRLEEAAGCSLRGPLGSLVPQRLAKVLYHEKGYPPQFKKEQGRKTEKETTDVEALLTLKRKLPSDQFLSDILLHRHLEGVRETLQIKPDAVDGRVRCGYSLEAETGRVKCYTSDTGSGANLQTIQQKLRTNYCADPGYDLAQGDLEGADGWTVACRSASLNDSTMLDDYKAGMKPAKIIALLYYFGQDINLLDRESLKWNHDNVFPIVKDIVGKWLYLGCKRVQHGSSYLMGIQTMILNVLKDSFKESGDPIYLEHSVARQLQENGMFARYRGVRTWQAWAESKLRADGMLTASNGHTRIFFGRRFGKDIQDTVKQFLAHEPQMNTTWATNLAALRLWNDPKNRRGGKVLKNAYDTWFATLDQKEGGLFIEPLHQVHDALVVQWPSHCRDWARPKFKSYFDNELDIAGYKVTIPIDGKYGSNWGNLPHPL